MVKERPLLIALPLDHETADIVATALELGRRLTAPVVVVHALPPRRLEGERGSKERIAEARAELDSHLAPLRAAGVVIDDVVVTVGPAAEVVIATASRLGVQMIVTGGGRPATVRRWVVGSVAEAIVGAATAPVWVVRGELPAGRPLLCPIDLSAESKLGLATAIKMARLFGLPLSLLTVVSSEVSQLALDDQAATRRRVEALLAEYDVDGVDVSVELASGDPAERIVDAAQDAGLLVIASRGYDPLVREWLGPVTSRALRYSLCSALMIRHLSEGHSERVRALTQIADAYQQARALVADGRGQEVLPVLERLAEQAPTNAAIQETLAIALEGAGRQVEATSRHEIAVLIRDRLS